MELEAFKNETFTDFTQPENHQAMSEALTKVRGQLGQQYDLIIGGEQIRCEHQFQ